MKFLILILIFLFYTNVYASNNRIIKIAYYENYYPFSFRDNAHLKGLFIDIANYILEEKMHYKVISEGFPWERAQEYVKKGDYDSHITLKTKDRENFLTFNNIPIFISETVLAYSSTNPKKDQIKAISSKDSLKKFVINGYIGDKYLNNNFSINDGFNIDFSSDIETSLKKLSANRGDVMIIGTSIFEQLIKKNNIKSLKIKKIFWLDNTLKYYFSIRKSYLKSEKIVKEFDLNLINSKKSGKINKFYLKYNLAQ